MFQLETNGSGFSLVHEFAGGLFDGAEPSGDLSLEGSVLYGLTPLGGEHGSGTVFSYQVPEPRAGVLMILGCFLLAKLLIQSPPKVRQGARRFTA